MQTMLSLTLQHFVSAGGILAHADPSTRDQCYLDWRTLPQTTALGGPAQQSANAATLWQLWQTFCADVGINAHRLPAQDPVPLLQVYAHRYRTGTLAPGRRSVRAGTVEDAL